MVASLHLFFTRALPELDDDPGSDLLFVDDEEGDPDGEIAPEELEYVTTLVTTYENIDLPFVAFRRASAEARAEAIRFLVASSTVAH